MKHKYVLYCTQRQYLLEVLVLRSWLIGFRFREVNNMILKGQIDNSGLIVLFRGVIRLKSQEA